MQSEERNTLVKLAKAVIEHAPEGGDAFWDIKFSDIEAALSAAEPVKTAPRLPYDIRLQIGKALDHLVCSDSTPEQVDTFIRTFEEFGLTISAQMRDGSRTLPYDRDTLGRFVREAWVRWAETQPDPKPSWLVPYDQLSETDKEADRQIGEAVARWTLIGDASRYSKIKEHLDNIEATSDAISSPYRNSIIRKNALSALSALSAQVQDVAIPEGWQLVPKEPTEEIISKLTLIIRQSAWGRNNVVHQWAQLLAAAPAKREGIQ
ncbi:hypothetical protein [Agrobacterium pusense]|uniref:hypothetical protein n=1 Tax=Agrobacterium pusense TaxID=648995 RepID=UPI001AE411C2|nr:hypothetical protein [Agrobacterium pusense]MBP2613049.1 hypothetical protein [Agrobacterium pusense]